MLDTLAKKQGFKDYQELRDMTKMVDLEHNATRRAFLIWTESDRTKDGLKTVLKIKELEA